MNKFLLIPRNFRFHSYLVFFLSAQGIAMCAPISTCPIPLERGTQWTYEGSVKWTIADSATVKSGKIRWSTEVVDTVMGTDSQAAIIKGFPDELAWYEPNKKPGFCVIFCTSNNVYQLVTTNVNEAIDLAHDLVKHPGRPSPSTMWLQCPLTEGAKCGDDTNRDDAFYCWYVEQKRTEKFHYDGNGSGKSTDVFTVAYRTMPDHQLVDIAPGIGITRYVYGHHGTVAETDVHLVWFKHPTESMNSQ